MLEEWLTLAQAGEDETAILQAWRRIHPRQVLDELQHLLLAKDRDALQHLYRGYCDPIISQTFQYLFNETADYASRDQAGTVVYDQIWNTICGMIACAIAALDALVDHQSLSTSAANAAALWQGIKYVSSSPFTPPLDGSPADWLEAALRTSGDKIPVAEICLFGRMLIQNSSPTLHPTQSRVTPLLIFRAVGEGLVCHLHICRIPGGTGEFFPEPMHMALYPMTRDFTDATRTAWQAAISKYPQYSKGDNYFWWIEGLEAAGEQLTKLEGASHGAAMAAALTRLLTNEAVDSSCVVTAAIDERGVIYPVAGVPQKAVAAFRLKDERLEPVIRRLFVHPTNLREARAAAITCGREANSSVIEVNSIDDILAEISGNLDMLRNLIQGEMSDLMSKGLRLSSMESSDLDQWEKLAIPWRVAYISNAQPGSLATGDWNSYSARIKRGVLSASPGQGLTNILRLHTARRCSQGLASLAHGEQSAWKIRTAIYLTASELIPLLHMTSTVHSTLLQPIARHLISKRRLVGADLDFLVQKLERGDIQIIMDELETLSSPEKSTISSTIRNVLDQYPQLELLVGVHGKGNIQEQLGLGAEHAIDLLPLSEEQTRHLIRACFPTEPETAQDLYDYLECSSAFSRTLKSTRMLDFLCRKATELKASGKNTIRWQQRGPLIAQYINELLDYHFSRHEFLHTHQSTFLDFASDLSLELAKYRVELAEAQTISAMINNIQISYPVLAGLPLRDLLRRIGFPSDHISGTNDQIEVIGYPYLLEYLAARSLARTANTGSSNLSGFKGWDRISGIVDAGSWSPEWKDIIIFLSGQIYSPEPLLAMLANKSTDDMFRHRLALAACCLPEIEQL